MNHAYDSNFNLPLSLARDHMTASCNLTDIAKAAFQTTSAVPLLAGRPHKLKLATIAYFDLHAQATARKSAMHQIHSQKMEEPKNK